MRALALLLPLTVVAQTSIPDTPQFARILGEVLASAKPYPELPFRGYVYSKEIALPGAGLCSLNDFSYTCEWEAKPNKYSVGVLEASLTTRVAKVVPANWPRYRQQDPGKRIAVFSDPAHLIRILVTAPESESDVILPKYTVSLTIDRSPVTLPHVTSEQHFDLGEQFLRERSYQAAANEFREALQGNAAPKWLEAMVHLELGKIFDLTGQRDRAINEYRQVQRTGDNSRGALVEAAGYLAVACRVP